MKMTAVQRKRSYRFAKFLMTKVKEDSFDLDFVCLSSSNNTSDAKIMEELTRGCGTVACAIGHLPLFNKKRFSYEIRPGDRYIHVRDNVENHNSFSTISENYLGFTARETAFLFINNFTYKGITTAKEVGSRIEGLLKKDKATLDLFEYYLSNSFGNTNNL